MGPTVQASPNHTTKQTVEKGSVDLSHTDSAPDPLYPDGVSPTDFSRFILLNPHVVDSGLWEDYYTKSHMMSPSAKENLVLPDKKPLPSIVQRDVINIVINR